MKALAGRARAPRALISGVLFLSIHLCGCSTTYEELMRPIRQDFCAGNTRIALDRLEGELEGSGKNRPLYLMERAVIHQRLGDFKAAQEDLMAADEQLEVLDFKNDTGGKVAEFTFSPSLTLYRGQPHEKILLNTLNMVNFLAEGDLTAARIEARRAGQAYDYQLEVEEEFDYKNPLTMILYGLVFEASRRPNDAYIAFRNAYEMTGAEFLKPRLLHIAREIRHSDLTRWEQQFGDLPPPLPEGHGAVLVLVMNGRTPIRVERVVQVPAPMMNISHEGVSFATLGRRTIRFPELVKQSHRFPSGRVRIGGLEPASLAQAVDIESQAMARFEDERPSIMAACVTRLLIRSVATGAAATAVEKGVEKDGKEMSPISRSIIESFFDSILAQFDVPDLRCWSLLPAEILIGLEAVPAGEHTVTVEMTGSGSRTLSENVSVGPGTLSVVQFFVTE